MHQCVDKYDVRKFVKSKGLGDILNKCYGVYESEDDYDAIKNLDIVYTKGKEKKSQRTFSIDENGNITDKK